MDGQKILGKEENKNLKRKGGNSEFCFNYAINAKSCSWTVTQHRLLHLIQMKEVPYDILYFKARASAVWQVFCLHDKHYTVQHTPFISFYNA